MLKEQNKVENFRKNEKTLEKIRNFLGKIWKRGNFHGKHFVGVFLIIQIINYLLSTVPYI